MIGRTIEGRWTTKSAISTAITNSWRRVGISAIAASTLIAQPRLRVAHAT